MSTVHTMLATTAALAKRGCNTTATFVPDDHVLESVGFNFNSVQDIHSLDYHYARYYDERLPGFGGNQARCNSPYQFAIKCIESDPRDKPSTLGTPSLNWPRTSTRLPFTSNAEGNIYEEDLYNDSLLANPINNLDVDGFSDGMSSSTSSDRPSKLGSRSGKGRFANPPRLGENVSPSPRVTASGRIVPKPSSRRQRVPGENAPRMASTWRPTTSSRGSDNPLRDQFREKPTSHITSGSGTRSSTRRNGSDDHGIDYDQHALPFTSHLEPATVANSAERHTPAGYDPPIDQFWRRPFGNSSTRTGVQQLDSIDLGAVPHDDDDQPWLSIGRTSNRTTEDQSLFPDYNPDWSSNSLSTTSTSADPSFNAYDFSMTDLHHGDTTLPQMSDINRTDQNISEFQDDPFDLIGPPFKRPRDLFHNTDPDFEDYLSPSYENLQANRNDSNYIAPTNIYSSHNVSEDSDRSMGLKHRSNIKSLGGHNLESTPQSRNDWSSSLFSTPPFGALNNRESLQATEGRTPPMTNLAIGRNPNIRSLILGDAGFSNDFNSLPLLHQGYQGYQASTTFNSNEQVSPLPNFADAVSPSEEDLENNSSTFAGGSEYSDDIRETQMVHQHSARKHSSSSSRINTKFGSLKDSNGGPIPILELFEDTNATQPEVQKILAKANRKSSPVRPLGRTTPRKIATTWQHTFVVQTKVDNTSGDSLPDSSSHKARRKGPLAEDIADSARIMRKLGSCLRCRTLKIKCTPGEICKPCFKGVHSPLNNWITCRSHLSDYASVFLPVQAIRAFQPDTIHQFLQHNVSGFSDNMMEILVVSGPDYPPIRLTVHEFRPRDPGILVFKKLVTDEISKVSTFTKAYSPPLGIAEGTQDLSGKLIAHIREIVQGKRSYGEVSIGLTSQIVWDMYDAIRLYQQAKPENSFLEDILMLYSMQYFMTMSITISEESSTEALKNMRRPTELDYTHNPNLRLINMQTKHEMYNIIRGAYINVLRDLEKELRPKERKLWVPAFCGIMIISMCAEMVQVTTDLRIVNALDDVSKSATGLDKNGNKPSRDDSLLVFRNLDNLPIEAATHIFHLAHRTTKSKDGFNPIRDGFDHATRVQLGQDDHDFITRIQHIVHKHRDGLDSRAAPPDFSSYLDPLSHHAVLREQNSGRLVAKFLRSFLT